MTKGTLAFLVIAAAANAQTTVPTPEPVGPVRGENVAGYNIVNSVETGYRWSTVGGNLDSYRSQVNYGDGVRLLSGFFSMNSLDGHGRFFDNLVLTAQGLGGDPYESAILRIEKNHLYRFDMNWRLNDYVNPGLTSDGQQSGNAFNTSYTAQDDDLVLFPQSKVKFFLGYSRGVQQGPSITTVGSLDASLDSFPTFSSIRDARNEYRVGNEVQFFGIKLNWMHGWEDFKEDYSIQTRSPESPVFGGATTLNSFQRTNPYHGTSPYWRVALFSDHKWFSMNGRFTYTGTKRAFVLQQNGLIGGALGPNLQLVTLGTGDRPVATGNLNLSFFPSSKFTITNSTSVYNVRTEGHSELIQFANPVGFQTQYFLKLGIRTIANQTDLNYSLAPWLGFFGGYHYSDRLITNILDPTLPVFTQTNILHAGIFGVRIRPVQGLTILLNGEVGRSNLPFTPKSDANYHALDARVQYRRKSLMLSAYSQANYNNNSTSLTAYSSHARTYAANLSWSPLRWLSFTTDYSKMHLDTLGGIAFFQGGDLPQSDHSLFISNLQTGNLGIRLAFLRRVDLYLGYSHVQDTGDGRNNPLGSGFGPQIPAFQAAQTFPLRFLSPVGRLSLKISNRIRWNVGYQYYGYHENFFTGQDFTTDQAYRAATGYTSILWSF